MAIFQPILSKYPKVLETDSLRDIQITLETSIDAVFLYEGLV